MPLSTENSDKGPTPEETDQLQRSIKKHKRDDDHHAYPGTYSDDDMHVEDGWSGPTFVDAVQGKTSSWAFYTGEDEEDSMDDLSMADVLHPQSEVADPNTCPVVDLPWEEYKAGWLPAPRPYLTGSWQILYVQCVGTKNSETVAT